MRPEIYATGSWFQDEPFFLGKSDGTVRTGTNILRDAPTFEFMGNWGAAHAGGANFALVDGSVRLIRYGTPPTTVQALLTFAGGEPAELD